MTITWYGHSCVRIDTREATLAIDPFSKEIGFTPPRFRADIVLVTHAHPDHANAEALAGEPRVISGPGEYEARGISIRGIATFHDAAGGKERGPNTAYRIIADDIALVHLGDFGERELREETLEALGDVDILLLPVGGGSTIDGRTAAAIVRAIEPRVAIPMHYRLPGLKVPLSPAEEFLKAAGASQAERLEKLTLKKKDLPETEARLIVLEKN